MAEDGEPIPTAPLDDSSTKPRCLQQAYPGEEELELFAHHISTTSVPDTAFRSSRRAAPSDTGPQGDHVSFVFSCEVTGKLISPAEEEAFSKVSAVCPSSVQNATGAAFVLPASTYVRRKKSRVTATAGSDDVGKDDAASASNMPTTGAQPAKPLSPASIATAADSVVATPVIHGTNKENVAFAAFTNTPASAVSTGHSPASSVCPAPASTGRSRRAASVKRALPVDESVVSSAVAMDIDPESLALITALQAEDAEQGDHQAASSTGRRRRVSGGRGSMPALEAASPPKRQRKEAPGDVVESSSVVAATPLAAIAPQPAAASRGGLALSDSDEDDYEDEKSEVCTFRAPPLSIWCAGNTDCLFDLSDEQSSAESDFELDAGGSDDEDEWGAKPGKAKRALKAKKVPTAKKSKTAASVKKSTPPKRISLDDDDFM